MVMGFDQIARFYFINDSRTIFGFDQRSIAKTRNIENDIIKQYIATSRIRARTRIKENKGVCGALGYKVMRYGFNGRFKTAVG